MGIRNSSLTRVKPLFDFIDSDIDKLNRFIGLFDNTQRLEQNSLIEIQYGDNEKKIPPSKSLLVWMLQNLNDLNQEVKNYGVDSIDSKTFKKREQLFSGDTKTFNEALNLIQTKPKLRERDWFIFEGYTSPDIFIETTDSIFVGEAKRTENDIITNTRWLSQRDQLIRHIDSFLDQPKNIYSFYILEGKTFKKYYEESMKLYNDKSYFELNLKHRNEEEVNRAFQSFIGFIFWEDLANQFGITFPETIL